MKSLTRRTLPLLLLAFCTGMVYAEDYNDLIEEHHNYDWEAISLDLLADEMEQAARDEGLTNFQVFVHDNTISLIYRDLQFPPDSPEITSETRGKITSLTNVLSQFSGKNLLLEGHTAAVVDDEDDGTVLSGQRAAAVADEIAATGTFSRDNIDAIGHGEHKPIASNDTPEGMELNRRVEVSIVNKVEGEDITDESVWWEQLAGHRNPGYSVFMLSHERADEYSVEFALEEEGQGNLPVYYTTEGVAVVYDKARFDENKKPSGETRDDVEIIAETLTEMDPYTQVKIGGTGERMILDEISEDQYNLGEHVAYNTAIEGSNTLVGLHPYSYYSCGGKSSLLAGIEFGLNGSLPLTRYGEFSHAGLGAGTALTLRLPGISRNSALAPLRFVLALEGLYHIPESTSSVESMIEADWLLGAGYKIDLAETFSVMPLLSYGGTVHVISATQEISPTSYNTLSDGTYYSQSLSFELDMDLAPEGWDNGKGGYYSLYLRPGYRIFFDEEYLGNSVTAKAGFRINY